MEIIRIRSYLKKLNGIYYDFLLHLGIVTIIFIIIFLALKNMPSQDKLIYCSIFLVVNLIILFINYLIIKNPFIFSKIYYYDNNKNRLRLSLYFFFFCFNHYNCFLLFNFNFHPTNFKNNF